MKDHEKKEVILKTLDRLNRSLDGDANALVTTLSGEISPESAYCELVQNILELFK
jgi:hypothetical protein